MSYLHRKYDNADRYISFLNPLPPATASLKPLAWRIIGTKSAVNRIRMSWSDFEESDIRAALRESCDDEDGAVDLLLGGYRAPADQVQTQQQTFDASDRPKWCRRLKAATPEPIEECGGRGDDARAKTTPIPPTTAEPLSHKKKERLKPTAPKEDFPSLLSNSSAEALNPQRCMLIGRYAASAAASARSCTLNATAESRDEFPCLPEPQHQAIRKTPGRAAFACPSKQYPQRRR